MEENHHKGVHPHRLQAEEAEEEEEEERLVSLSQGGWRGRRKSAYKLTHTVQTVLFNSQLHCLKHFVYVTLRMMKNYDIIWQ